MGGRWLWAVAVTVMPVSAHAMDVNTFLTKANALKKKGVFAIGSPDIGLLKAEMNGVMRDYQADKAAAQKAGKPIACPPQGAKMSSNDLMAAFAALPPEQRGMSVKAAFYQMVRTRWPCPRA